jgi:hypothetical protein
MEGNSDTGRTNPDHSAADRDGRPRLATWLARSVAAVVLFLPALEPGTARAGLVLGFGASQYSVAPGQGIDVPVFLTESGTTILATDGLNSAGLFVSFNLPARVSAPAQVTAIAVNPGVNDLDDFLSTSISPATGSTTGTAELMFSIVLSDVLKPPIGSTSILLGTFHFVAGSIPGQVTNLSTGVLPGGPQFLSGTGQNLDSMITTGTTAITVQGVSSVPEPSGLVLLGTGLLGLLGHAWRSRRAASVQRTRRVSSPACEADVR